MGVDVDRTIAVTFLIAGALAGAAGVVQILYNNTTVWNLGFRFGLNSFTAAVLGGIGNLQGAVLGAIVLGFINAFSDRFFSANWTNALVFGVLIAILVFRADRPPRPAAGGSSMSTTDEQPIGTGFGGWVGHLADSAAAIPGHYRRAAGGQPRPDHPADGPGLLGRLLSDRLQQFSWPGSAGTCSRCRSRTRRPSRS